MAGTTVEELPEDCLSQIISMVSPKDACRSSVVSAAFRDAADSNVVWENFLPSDYREIISRSVSPMEFSSKKDLFRMLSSSPLLVDGGNKTFSIDKCTSKKCYMLSARDLSITWSRNSLFWSWKSHPTSRFPEVVELVMVCWLEIHGSINSRMLSPNTTYGAYLIVRIMDRAFGLELVPAEASIEVGRCKTQRTIRLKCNEHKSQGSNAMREVREWVFRVRRDGWLEVELGEFYNSGSDDREVKMWFREIKGVHLKGGLLVEGIELRPKL